MIICPPPSRSFLSPKRHPLSQQACAADHCKRRAEDVDESGPRASRGGQLIAGLVGDLEGPFAGGGVLREFRIGDLHPVDGGGDPHAASSGPCFIRDRDNNGMLRQDVAFDRCGLGQDVGSCGHVSVDVDDGIGAADRDGRDQVVPVLDPVAGQGELRALQRSVALVDLEDAEGGAGGHVVDGNSIGQKTGIRVDLLVERRHGVVPQGDQAGGCYGEADMLAQEPVAVRGVLLDQVEAPGLAAVVQVLIHQRDQAGPFRGDQVLIARHGRQIHAGDVVDSDLPVKGERDAAEREASAVSGGGSAGTACSVSGCGSVPGSISSCSACSVPGSISGRGAGSGSASGRCAAAADSTAPEALLDDSQLERPVFDRQGRGPALALVERVIGLVDAADGQKTVLQGNGDRCLQAVEAPGRAGLGQGVRDLLPQEGRGDRAVRAGGKASDSVVHFVGQGESGALQGISGPVLFSEHDAGAAVCHFVDADVGVLGDLSLFVVDRVADVDRAVSPFCRPEIRTVPPSGTGSMAAQETTVVPSSPMTGFSMATSRTS